MKSLLIAFTLIALTGVAAFEAQAKVGDFNNLIVENTKAQNELHQNLKQDLETTRLAYKTEATGNYIVDNESSSINVPTSKSLLTFQKEKKYYRASEKQGQKRLAEEFSDAE